MFYHSVISDWNHGNAHFLRGVVRELLARGHTVEVYEPSGGWSRANLLRERGVASLTAFVRAFPELDSRSYTLAQLDLDSLDVALEDVDLVIVHEWNDPELIRRLGQHRHARGGYRLLFHDTHHRCVTAAGELSACDLSNYDGVLAFGEVIRELYLARGWIARAWTWHEAADTRLFRPITGEPRAGDLVWIGNWGDGERSEELREFLIDPVAQLGLEATCFGVQYPPPARRALANAGVGYGGWLPNHEVPRVFARYAMTVHVPRRPYVESLVGIPTIRPFEALACGIPLICSPWHDREGLFEPGVDYLVARDGAQMVRHMRALLSDRSMAHELAAHGRACIERRHTCAHRVDELLTICRELGLDPQAANQRESERRS
jgi:spore maturation protein CgeB